MDDQRRSRCVDLVKGHSIDCCHTHCTLNNDCSLSHSEHKCQHKILFIDTLEKRERRNNR